MQDVQTFSRRGVLPTIMRLRWMFGFQRRGVRRCENDTLLPKPGPLPQTSHTEATSLLQFGRSSDEFPAGLRLASG